MQAETQEAQKDASLCISVRKRKLFFLPFLLVVALMLASHLCLHHVTAIMHG